MVGRIVSLFSYSFSIYSDVYYLVECLLCQVCFVNYIFFFDSHVVLSDPPYKDGHVRFTPVPIKPSSEMEFIEFDPRFKSAKTRFELSAGLNLETLDTILSETNHI